MAVDLAFVSSSALSMIVEVDGVSSLDQQAVTMKRGNSLCLALKMVMRLGGVSYSVLMVAASLDGGLQDRMMAKMTRGDEHPCPRLAVIVKDVGPRSST
jgi:hypothetical protein